MINRFCFRICSSIMLIAFVFICLSCSKNTIDNPASTGQNAITIDLNSRKQVIRNFGASDAWACQYVGVWPDEKKSQVADWLFSMDNDANGKPKGIGLSLWRFNIGAGSDVQQNISDEWRMTDGFLNDDLTYNWSSHTGQRWFMNAAKSRGVDQFVGFTNSPPVQLTKNGKAFSSDGESANLSKENFVPYAGFLADVAMHFEEEKLPFTYLSPFNEPQWDWTGNNQEGTPYTNNQIAEITRALDSVISARNMKTKIQIAEAGKANYLYEPADKTSRGNQVREFFHADSPNYLGNLPAVDRIISGHSYFTTAPVETLRDVRQKLSESINAASVPLEFWQSEYCILGGQEEVKAEGKDTGIDPALYVARIIHHDLTLANASAWHWWLAVSVYDYKDGLIYADKNKTNGNIEDTKLLWALGNFSRFIRPGSKRVLTTAENFSADNANGIMVSSYINESEQKVISVIINYSFSDTNIIVNTNGGEVSSWKPFITGKADDENLKPLPEVIPGTKINIPKRSVITLVGELK